MHQQAHQGLSLLLHHHYYFLFHLVLRFLFLKDDYQRDLPCLTNPIIQCQIVNSLPRTMKLLSGSPLSDKSQNVILPLDWTERLDKRYIIII